jgi:NADH dehydrogenase FAD-containing subunit
MEPIRNFLRHKKAAVKYYEAEATKIDYEKRVVYVNDESPIKGDVSQTEIPFDMLVVGVGAENATFGTLPPRAPTTRDLANLALQVSPVCASTVCS